MKKIFKFIKSVLKVILGRSSIVDISNITFSGWKMATGSYTPWQSGDANILSKSFESCDIELMRHVIEKNITLTQFNPKTVHLEVPQLKWRHFVVYWTASLASNLKTSEHKNFAEMGVCDGLTAYFASHARKNNCCDGDFYLYDSWDEMVSGLLTESEKQSAGAYAYLNINNTKKNLSLCDNEKFVFVEGYIPESFKLNLNPQTLAWLHIDLNSSIPTVASLDFFWDKILTGGIILFDDYAWPGYEDTKLKVDQWCLDKSVSVFHMPTGQGLLFKP